MLEFIQRNNRARRTELHEYEFQNALAQLYTDASTYLVNQKILSKRGVQTDKVDWFGPVFAMTDWKWVETPIASGVSLRLGLEKVWFFQTRKPRVLIACRSEIKPPDHIREERYILSENGALTMVDPNLQSIDWPNIPEEELANRIQLVQEAIAAYTGHPTPA